MTTKAKSVYSWFDTKEYAAAGDLEPFEWAFMLDVRLRLQSIYDIVFRPYLDGKMETQDLFWTAYRNVVSPKRFFERKDKGELGPQSEHRWALLELPIPMLATGNPAMSSAIGFSDPRQLIVDALGPLSDQRSASSGVPIATFSNLRLLIVDPSAGDLDLQDEFKQWLKKMREEFPSPFKTQGPRAVNAQLKRSRLNKWVKCNILGLFDLQFCRRVFGQKKISYPELYEIIRPSVELDLWPKEARKELKFALKNRRFLRAQSARKKTKG